MHKTKEFNFTAKRQDKKKYGYFAMTADFIHSGHIKAIDFCLDYCYLLYIGLMTDDIVMQYKGRKPLMSYIERMEVLYKLKGVYGVVEQNTFEFPKSLLSLKDSIIIFDSIEHKRDGYDILVPYTNNISSTKIKEHLIEGTNFSQLPL